MTGFRGHELDDCSQDTNSLVGEERPESYPVPILSLPVPDAPGALGLRDSALLQTDFRLLVSKYQRHYQAGALPRGVMESPTVQANEQASTDPFASNSVFGNLQR